LSLALGKANEETAKAVNAQIAKTEIIQRELDYQRKRNEELVAQQEIWQNNYSDICEAANNLESKLDTTLETIKTLKVEVYDLTH
jgi:FtsZ-binding cell division protein ZapB